MWAPPIHLEGYSHLDSLELLPPWQRNLFIFKMGKSTPKAWNNQDNNRREPENLSRKKKADGSTDEGPSFLHLQTHPFIKRQEQSHHFSPSILPMWLHTLVSAASYFNKQTREGKQREQEGEDAPTSLLSISYRQLKRINGLLFAFFSLCFFFFVFLYVWTWTHLHLQISIAAGCRNGIKHTFIPGFHFGPREVVNREVTQRGVSRLPCWPIGQISAMALSKIDRRRPIV